MLNRTKLKGRFLCAVACLLMNSGWSQVWNLIGLPNPGYTVDELAGSSVDVTDDGTMIAFGSPGESSGNPNAGLVTAVVWIGSPWWAQEGQLLWGSQSGEKYGGTVSLNGDGTRLAVGTDGSDFVEVYSLVAWNWVLMGSPFVGDTPTDAFGQGLELSNDGNRIAISARDFDGTAGVDAGLVRVFEWDGAAWQQMGIDLEGAAAGDRFGSTIDFNRAGDTLAVSSELSNSIEIYAWNGTNWVSAGMTLVGGTLDLYSEFAMSDNGEVLVVGDPNNSDIASTAGAAQCYEWDGAAWQLRGATFYGANVADSLGQAVDISADGRRIVITVPGDDTSTGGAEAGSLTVYEWDGLAWNIVASKLDGPLSNYKMGHDVAMNPDGSVFVVGSLTPGYDYWGSADVYHLCADVIERVEACDQYTWPENGMTYTASDTITISGVADTFGCVSNLVLELTISPTQLLADSVLACNEYTWAVNGQTYVVDGTYDQVFTGASGCDSTQRLVLTIDQVDTSVTHTGMTLIANESSALFYQWLDCNNGMTPIPGENAALLTPLANGSYAVVIENSNGCTDTSFCHDITELGISNESITKLELYPNPTKDQFTLIFNSFTEGNGSLAILDITGRQVQGFPIHMTHGRNQISLSIDLSSGIYQVIVQSENSVPVSRQLHVTK